MLMYCIYIFDKQFDIKLKDFFFHHSKAYLENVFIKFLDVKKRRYIPSIVLLLYKIAFRRHLCLIFDISSINCHIFITHISTCFYTK